LRQCARGDNVLTTGGVSQVQTLTLTRTGVSIAGNDEIILTFTTLTGASYTTGAIKITDALGADKIATNVKNALMSLPNHAIPSVTVGVTLSPLVITVTFNDAANAGSQNALKVGWTGCRRAGCAPYYSGVVGTDATTTATFAVAVTTAASTESAVCSEHGVCDTATGLCKCFHGYYNENCSEQTVLV
jgi:hypothetical protein